MRLVRKRKGNILDGATGKCSRSVAGWSTGAFRCEHFKASCLLLWGLPNHAGTLQGAGHCFLLPAGLQRLSGSESELSVPQLGLSQQGDRPMGWRSIKKTVGPREQVTATPEWQPSSFTLDIFIAVPALLAACCSQNALLMPSKSTALPPTAAVPGQVSVALEHGNFSYYTSPGLPCQNVWARSSWVTLFQLPTGRSFASLSPHRFSWERNFDDTDLLCLLK